MRHKEKLAHMAVAETYAKLSYAKRLQVGAVLVKDNNVISFGYNGTPTGWDNCCEEPILYQEPSGACPPEITGMKTKAEVHHAEQNLLMKLLKSGTVSLKDSTLFITHSPCLECAKMIALSGISIVIFRNLYRSEDGINFLKKCNIKVEKLD